MTKKLWKALSLNGCQKTMIDIILTGLISGAVSAGLVILYSKHIQSQRLTRMMDAAQGMLDAIEESVINARIEFDENIMRAYNNDTDEFLAQGKDWEELNRLLRSRFPDKMFNVSQDQIDKATSFNR